MHTPVSVVAEQSVKNLTPPPPSCLAWPNEQLSPPPPPPSYLRLFLDVYFVEKSLGGGSDALALPQKKVWQKDRCYEDYSKSALLPLQGDTKEQAELLGMLDSASE